MSVTNNSRGAPTSGRYVYSYGASTGVRRWYWQCDLHGDEYDEQPELWEGNPSWHGPDEGFTTWPEAFNAALAHVPSCGHTNQ